MTNYYTEWYTSDMENRQAILDSALALFAARGYDAVGVQEICDSAGITKPTLYHYFGSKRGLLHTLLDHYFALLSEKLMVPAQVQHDLPLTLQSLAETFFEFAREYPQFYRLQLGLWFAPVDCEAFQVISEVNRFQHNLLSRVFLESVQQHGNMRGRHEAYAVTFLGMLNTYIGLGLNGLADLNVDLARQAVRQFQYGIYT